MYVHYQTIESFFREYFQALLRPNQYRHRQCHFHCMYKKENYYQKTLLHSHTAMYAHCQTMQHSLWW